ncbi:MULTISPECIES: GntR family transcriptional regulator [Paenibacillus]|uniref:Transcriptional regulator, GntR family n=3 Tax=Paenibacillus TaxID=44249 RepID=G4HN11_9BACL|nr:MULTISPECIES: GntR family transcriptional regulator [Paenibacillus]ANY73096.1 GntR family transcriptional regulator [Paenibacillus ihbetae]EHB54376.1 transcriptional regulator, GntR family [Paenibacillus lactis 154]MBP1891633.1 GntR family transcriptional regulator [Paenibacillus lactis]MCM3494097.1 GntR family transcriptional regulator [Paenibacillus lactis]OOC59006.1 GntR family transcriptional regulator [Paenibacillus ihbetae]
MRIPIQINENSAEPLYHQIETQLRSLIISGQIEEGTLLPSIREFAGNLNCSVITVRRVYQDLESEGLLRTRQGTGTFVAGVGDQAREQFKRDAVIEALNLAVDRGLAVQMKQEELIELFMEVVRERYQSRGGH